MRAKNVRMLVSVLLSLLLVVAFAACSPDSDDSETGNAPEVTITSKEATIEVGESYMLTYTTTGENVTATVSVTEKDGGTGGTYNESDGTFSATAAGEYTLTVTATNADGEDSASVVVTVTEPAVPASVPEITFTDKQDSYTVAVGQTLTLPAAKATDSVDGDITGDLDVSMGTVSTGTTITKVSDGNYTFSSTVAGEHSVSYYVVNSQDEDAEEFIDIMVTPLTNETEIGDAANIENLNTSGKTYTANLAAGYEDIFVKGLTMSGTPAASVIGTEDAIAGNSLLLDYSECIYSTNTAFYFDAVTSDTYLKSGKWTLSFDVKVLEGNLPGNQVYLFFMRDGMTDIPGTARPIATDGTVTNVSLTINQTMAADETWHCGLFTYTGDSSFTYDGLKLVIDNISFTWIETVDATVIRTEPAKTIDAEDLDGDGWTFTGSDNNYTEVYGSSAAIYLQKYLLAEGSYLTEEQEALLTPENGFSGDAVVYTTKQQTGFRSIMNMCLDPDYDYTLTLRVYLPQDVGEWHYWSNGQDAGMSAYGASMGTVAAEARTAGLQTWTITFQGNAQNIGIGLYRDGTEDVFIGDITISRTPHVTAEETPNGAVVGDTWTYDAGDGLAAADKFTIVNGDDVTLSDGSKLSSKEGFSGQAIWWTKSSADSDAVGELWQFGGNVCEANCKYEITFVLYVDNLSGGALMGKFDNEFPNITSETGLQTVTLEWTGAIDFFCFYAQTGVTCDVYLASVTVELVEIL